MTTFPRLIQSLLSPAGRRRRPQNFRPCLEEFEGRLVPSAFTFNLNPPCRAENAAGETIRMTGAGTFDTGAASVLANGSFTISGSAGVVESHGTWTATSFVNFNSIGGPNAGLQAGILNTTVTLSSEGGTPVTNVPMRVICNLPGFSTGQEEGINVGSFTEQTGGATVFHLVSAALTSGGLTAAGTATAVVSPQTASVVATINGGGTALMDASVGGGISLFGMGVQLFADGSARGQFTCVDQVKDPFGGNFFGQINNWSLNADGSISLSGTGKAIDFPGGLVDAPRGVFASDIPFTVTIQQFGGPGVGHWTLDVPAFGGIVCIETLTSGQIVMR